MKEPVVRNVSDEAAVAAAKAAGTYVYVGRNSRLGTTRWGNPYREGRDGDRRAVIERYEKYLRIIIAKGDRLYGVAGEPSLADDIRALQGKELFCHCKPLLCHGDVLVKLFCELVAGGI